LASRHNVTAPIRLFTASLDAAGHGERERLLLPRLAPGEQARYSAFGATRRRMAWLAGRALLLSALEHTQAQADPAALVTAEDGGVAYRAAALHLNLSHGSGHLAAALASVPVGVDVERVRPRAVAGEAARLFTPTEAVWLAALPESGRLTAFYRLWTLKEAACKAAGLTVWDGLRHARFDLAGREARLESPFPGGEWSFMDSAHAPDARLALAWRGGAAKVEHWHREDSGWRRAAPADAVSIRGEAALS
jgi:phosphopantetheinyl transferase